MPRPDVSRTSSGPLSARAALFMRKNSAIRVARPRLCSRSEKTQSSVKQKFHSVDAWVAMTAETT